MGNFRTVQVTYPVRNFTQLVSSAAQGGPVFLFNTDTVNTVYLTDAVVGNPVTVDSVPLGPLSGYGVDGNTSTYAFMLTPGQTANVSLMPGGTTFFQPASLAAIGGVSVFIQASAPTGIIPLNSLWFDTANSSLQTWNGSTWTPQLFNAQNILQVATILGNLIANQAITSVQVANSTLTSAQIAAAAGILGTQIAAATITSGNIAANTIVANNIAANTITAAKLAAGIVYAGIVDATTINAATFIGSVFQGTEIIINGTGTFWYRGTPGANTLRMSAVGTIASVQDPFGNWALPGLTVYAGSGPYSAYEYFANAISTATTTVMTGVTDPWTAVNAIVYTLPGLILKGPVASTDGTSASPTLITTDVWTTITSFGAGFAANSPAPQYALEPTGVNSLPNIRLRGVVSVTGATAASAVMFTVPYVFARNQDYVTPNNLAGYAAGNRVVRAAGGGGNIQCQVIGANTNFVILDGIVVATS